MAVYTMELWRAMEFDPTIAGDVLATYPLFDEGHREELNRKIVNHYANQEIGMETVEMFRFALRRKLDEIMPLYNQQYEISAIKFNQLETVRINNTNNTTGTTNTSSNSSNNSGSNAKSRAVSQQLPQTLLSDNGDYATAAQDNISDTTANATATDATTATQDGNTDSITTGFQGNAALMILQYRQSLVNVDMMIIDELQTLFMQIWGNGDSFTQNNFGYFGYGRYFI
jgi:hypothetical protein